MTHVSSFFSKMIEAKVQNNLLVTQFEIIFKFNLWYITSINKQTNINRILSHSATVYFMYSPLLQQS